MNCDSKVIEELDERLVDLLGFIYRAEHENPGNDIGYRMSNVVIAQFIDTIIRVHGRDSEEIRSFYQRFQSLLFEAAIDTTKIDSGSLH